ncbi:MAG TPA: TadE family protein [Erythrobacter sp.]|nr:TadE family protein [Erythrobacter sp.]
MRIAKLAASLPKRISTLPRRLSRRLLRDRSGVAMIEFAFTAPILLGMGMLGTETAYLVVTHMKVSQVAMQVADNASRIGSTDVVAARRIFESDIKETFVGAEKLAEGIGIYQQGRIIISSVQQNEDGGQWVAWQRCRGAMNWESSFGEEGDGADGTGFPGMGDPGREITASPGTAVMFVEVAYTYDALTPFDIFDERVITYTAAFNIRDNRDLTGGPDENGLYVDGAPADCDTFSADRP